ncbi:hypothetical protein [Ohtaekwangia koreensis]|uniref:hypothetical protein n=1 Tax=Ohtaekwangia koreensis TaxID=688867 RepID=UPI00117F814E|nr:hypothetical protein [Ohtaekwangia koreensis]
MLYPIYDKTTPARFYRSVLSLTVRSVVHPVIGKKREAFQIVESLARPAGALTIPLPNRRVRTIQCYEDGIGIYASRRKTIKDKSHLRWKMALYRD